MNDRHDMTVMHTVHEVLRQHLRAIADAVAPATGGDPREELLTAGGWEPFKTALRLHHGAEDDALWPVLRPALDGRPFDLALLESLEAEHLAIDLLIGAVDEALATPDTGPDLLTDLTGSLVAGVLGHLGHEERAVLPLVTALVTEEQWARFERLHARRTGAGADPARPRTDRPGPGTSPLAPNSPLPPNSPLAPDPALAPDSLASPLAPDSLARSLRPAAEPAGPPPEEHLT
ncbi:hemerythrin domain-containing protein [Kitasatospora sp. NBC_00458]|uniref:hemerythrin domain-containing protein n=1 Tax=Kitasatospora sp. NBC_00458 TaxID=2903568 RepID=UPI002E17BB50